MTGIVKPLSISIQGPTKETIEHANVTFQPEKWEDLLRKYWDGLAVSSQKTTAPRSGVSQLTGLLQLQMEVSHYQLKVEVVSKVAESAVTSLRKLQQAQ